MQAPKIDLSSLRFLVADDSRFMRRLISPALRAFGARQIAETSSAHETLDRILQKETDIVLLDWEFGDGTGEWIMQQIRRPGHPSAYQTVIMMSGHDEQSKILRALDFGVNGYVAKPVAPARLYLQIARAVLQPKPFIRTQTYFGPENPSIARHAANRGSADSGAPKASAASVDLETFEIV